MNEQDRETIRKNRVKLRDNIANPDDINELLFERGVFTEAMKQEVEAQTTTRDKVLKILDILPRQGSQAFDIFCQILRDTGNLHSAGYLQKQPLTVEELTTGTTGNKAEMTELKRVPLLPEGKVYHVYFVYRTLLPDKDWVINVLKQLENEGFKCGYHERDFMPGETIISNINDALKKSLKVIIVLSPNFHSGWTKYETDLAKLLSLDQSSTRLSLIPVLISHCKVPDSLQDLTYLDAQGEEDKWWPRLKKAIIYTSACEDVQENEVVQTQFLLPEVWPDEKAMTMEINVIPCNRSSMVFKQNWDSPSTYSMKKRKRGRAIIICNKNFDSMSFNCRNGVEKDGGRMKELFEQLYFDVTLHNDLNSQDIMKVLAKEIIDPYHETADCFILMISSHADDGGIYGTDSYQISLQQILSLFASNSCPALANKPKIFFLEAPQGVTSSTRDMLVAFSTHTGSNSIRNTKGGSWFIQAVIWVFQRYAHEEELSSLMRKVNHIVSEGKSSGLARALCLTQASCYADHLTKKFYFFPGCHE